MFARYLFWARVGRPRIPPLLILTDHWYAGLSKEFEDQEWFVSDERRRRRPYQFIWWGWASARIMGRRKWSQILERPTSYDTIYEWSMRLGPVEVRKWTDACR